MPLLQTTGRFTVVIQKPFMPEGVPQSWIFLAKTGTPYVYLPGIVINGPCEGQEAYGYLYLTDPTQDRTFQTLIDCFNWDCDLDGLANGTAGFEGCEVDFTMEMETFEGKDRYKVAWINPVGSSGGGARIVPEKNAMTEIITKYQGRAKAIRARSDAAGTVPTVHKSASRGEPTTPKEDLPF